MLFREKKQLKKENLGRIISDLEEHVNKVNCALGLNRIEYREDSDFSISLEEINKQLTDIEGGICNIQGMIANLEKDKRKLQDNNQKLQNTIDGLSEKIKKLSKENNASENSIQDLNIQLRQQKSVIDGLNMDIREAGKREQEICSQLELLQQKYEESEGELEDRKAGLLQTISHMISFRDQLFSQLDYAKIEQNTMAMKIIEGTIMAMRSVLEDSKVVILSQKGSYDSSKQFIAKVIPTQDASLDMQIAETLKEGYLFNGKMIRQQEVAVYHYGKA